MSRPIRPLVLLPTTLAALALAPAVASAAPPAGASAARLVVPAGDGGSSSRADADVAALAVTTAAAERRSGRAPHRRVERRGGSVRPAWPRRARAPAPERRLARWLARQVGPVAAGSGKRERAVAAAAGPLARAAASPADPLLLVRSFEIPASDPQARALQNWSWTYDNALAVFAFLSVGSRSQAEQLLDQLRALQLSDGSFDFAYDVASGAGSARRASARSRGSGWRPPPTGATTATTATTS